MLWPFILFYLIICRTTPRYLELESLIHCLVSSFWHLYIIGKYIPGSMFWYNSLTNLTTYMPNHPELTGTFLLATEHSIGYFVADLLDTLIDYKNVKRRQYIFHHIISILGISMQYAGSFIGSYGIFYAEIGAIGHHLRRLNKNDKKIFFFYLMTYGITRILMILNVIHQTFHLQSGRDIIPIMITYPLVIQNSIWLYKNVKSISLGK